VRNKTVFLIGLDDTDNLESCGTGYHARSICSSLDSMGLAAKNYITRHQLLVSPLVPYTSHNSSACVRVTADSDNFSAIRDFCRGYLAENSAEGSDAGLCIASEEVFTTETQRFGVLCKRRLVTQSQARQLAKSNGIYLEGLTGTQDGVIGAFAATALHASGSDGRLLWLDGLREVADQRISLGELRARTSLDAVQSIEGELLADEDLMIETGPWPRAVMLGGEPVLILEKGEGSEPNEWRVATKNYLKQF